MSCRGRDLVIALALLVCGSLACQDTAEPPAVSEADLERAQAILAPFKEQLVGELMGSLGEGEPENAIHVCRERAPEIAAQLSVGVGAMGAGGIEQDDLTVRHMVNFVQQNRQH